MLHFMHMKGLHLLTKPTLVMHTYVPGPPSQQLASDAHKYWFS